MENKIEIFTNREFGSVRIIREGEKYLFCGADVASALGYSNTRDALRRHCKGDGVVKRDGVSSTTNQHGTTTIQTNAMLFITEGNVYRLITHSKLPSAERFEAWVFEEMLPSIRKHGAYMTDSLLDALEAHPEAVPEYLNRLRSENARNRELTRRLRIALPKAEYYDAFVDPADCTNIRTTAKELGVPEKQFTRYLEEKKYLFRDKNRKLFPRAVKKSAGLFLVKDFYTERGKLGHYTLITPAGKRHFLERTDEILFE